MSNIECRMSIDECRIKESFLFYFLKRAERSGSTIRHSTFDFPM
ncbi:hypothetical protein D1AOALGA4SA_9615 [Olavius algarvensis Delta 1 endosymbiont]|nr:hypothetical protein D1AOALGA4SA_9615 [Olavius algarvensis Delta 1 endosymbiont]